MLDKYILEKYKNDAQGLAEYFADFYYETHDKIFPLNPFQILTDLGIKFVFRQLKNLEGLYLPKSDSSDIDLIAINSNRPITRQRFSAAHELCHFLKDTNLQIPFMCIFSSNDFIEKYAEEFASAFLMPKDELRLEINKRTKNGKISLDDVLVISDHFGTSFQACFYRIRQIFPYLIPYHSTSQLKKYHPDRKRENLGLNNLKLYEDLFDSWECINTGITSEFAQQVFKNEYIFNDARMEKINTSFEATAEIIEDLQNNTQNSKYCTPEYDAFCHIAGHKLMYDSVFKQISNANITIYTLLDLNKKLFSCFPNPSYGGTTRTSNPLVLGAKFETVDYHNVSNELYLLNKKVISLEKNYKTMSRSEIVKEIMIIHHKITVIHPFGDGNGRTSRGFMNKQFLKYNLPPFYVKLSNKDKYYASLELADKKNDFTKLFEFTFKALIESHSVLAKQ